ncbi:winged helix DNA-binding domain-containing protein [Streptomyces sp. NPDC006283]|uniref:winged helix DNA-binding domain-containing protein n=1 Tax=Streptomyces sp. NPDC006283 TaxID=3156741 RepID=UPI0033B8B29C
MTKPPDVTWPQANARRLARQGLYAPGSHSSPAAVAGSMLGAHAQVLSAGELSIALRLPTGTTRAHVREALWTDRTLVKTYGPRGTVHLLPTADLPMWTGALSAVPAGPNQWPDHVRMTPEQTDEVVAAIRDALTGAELTIGELTDAIVERTGPWAGDRVMEAFQDMWPRWRQITHTAAHRGALAFGPNRGRNVTFTCPAVTPMADAPAVARLVRHYLYAYGPATPAHFARWLGVPKAWACEQFGKSANAGGIEAVAFEGAPAWVASGDTVFEDADPPLGVRFLPYFDAYAIACQPRERLFPGAAQTRALAAGQAGNYPVVLVDGIVAGVWHQRRSGKRLIMTVEPIGSALDRRSARKDLIAQADRVAEALEGRAELSVGPVTVGPHA